jgi:uncharacterized membrane protein YbhN (UPF0104 family)
MENDVYRTTMNLKKNKVKVHLPKHLKTALKIVLSVGILAFVLYKIDTKALLEVFAHVQPLWLLPALLFFALSKYISAFRLRRFLINTGIEISASFNLKLYLLGMFYNLFLPGGIGGDGYKIYLLNKRYDVKARSIFWGILLDRVMGLLALFCLAAALAAAATLPHFYKTFSWLLIPLAIIAFYFFIKILFNRYRNIFTITLLQSFLVQLSQIVSAFFILQAIGVNNATVDYLFLFLISSIVAALPITIGGIGSREITFLLGAQVMQLSTSDSIALSLLFYIITALVSLTGIYYSIKTEKLK